MTTKKEENLAPEPVLEADYVRGVKDSTKESVLYSVSGLRTRLNAEDQAFLKDVLAGVIDEVILDDGILIEAVLLKDGLVGGVLLDSGLINGNKKADIYSHDFTSDETWAAVSSLDPDTIVKVDIDCTDLTFGKINVEYDSASKLVVLFGEVKSVTNKASTDIKLISERSDFDISDTVYDTKFISLLAQGNGPTGVAVNDDITKLYSCAGGSAGIDQWSVSDPDDISTAIFDSVTLASGVSQDVFFKPDGTIVFALVGTIVTPYSLTTPWILSASTPLSTFNVSTQEGAPTGIRIKKDDGLKMWMIGTTNDTVYEYDLGVAWDVSTAVYNSVFKLVSSENSTPGGLEFNLDYSKMYMIGEAGSNIYQYTLPTPGTIAGAVYDTNSFSFSTQETAVKGIGVSSDFDKMYICGNSADSAFQYLIGGLFSGNAYAQVLK